MAFILPSSWEHKLLSGTFVQWSIDMFCVHKYSSSFTEFFYMFFDLEWIVDETMVYIQLVYEKTFSGALMPQYKCIM